MCVPPSNWFVHCRRPRLRLGNNARFCSHPRATVTSQRGIVLTITRYPMQYSYTLRTSSHSNICVTYVCTCTMYRYPCSHTFHIVCGVPVLLRIGTHRLRYFIPGSFMVSSAKPGLRQRARPFASWCFARNPANIERCVQFHRVTPIVTWTETWASEAGGGETEGMRPLQWKVRRRRPPYLRIKGPNPMYFPIFRVFSGWLATLPTIRPPLKNPWRRPWTVSSSPGHRGVFWTPSTGREA